MHALERRPFAAVLLGVALLALFIATAIGCATVSPMAPAQTAEQRAFALYGTFVVAEETAADLVQLPGLGAAQKAAIKDADAKAKPVADALMDAAREVFKIRGELEAGATTNDKLAVAVANLERWVGEATPKVQALVDSVRRK